VSDAQRWNASNVTAYSQFSSAPAYVASEDYDTLKAEIELLRLTYEEYRNASAVESALAEKEIERLRGIIENAIVNLDIAGMKTTATRLRGYLSAPPGETDAV
jgi:hypothetical protein